MKSAGHHHHAHSATGKHLLLTVLINVLITLAEFIGGLLSGSLALLSDALHNFSDVIALLISYIANKFSRKKANFSKTFGYKRAEIIAAFINAGTLIVIAVILIKEAIIRFFEPSEIADLNWVIILAGISIVGNGICVLLLQNESSHNLNIRSSYLHLLTDMYTSVAVLVGGLLMKFYGIYWVDGVLTLIIGGYLIYVGFQLLISSFNVLMLFSPEEVPLHDIVERVMGMEGVKNMHHVHIWALNEYEIHLEAHLDVERDIKISEFDRLLAEIEQVIHLEFGIHHFNIQPEFDRPDNKSVIVQD